MHDNELEKTFVERSPASMIPGALADDGGIPMPPNARPVVGQTRFGSSLITETIGEGGMATVYKVWNERLEVFRAVKLLTHEAYSERFLTEAKIVAKLHHDGIVEIHNISEWNGLPYMEMELVDGSDLQKTLAERGRLPEIVCLAIAAIIAEALSHAHTKTFTLLGKQYCGIIHRDLKPANILISKLGEVKLTDFGIARPAEASLHTVIGGNIAGTMHYLAPEQMNGEEVDNRSDIYSFGAILYEMVTGEKTFPQESLVELMKQKSDNKFKPLGEYGVPISAELKKIILRCLKFAPAKRYQSTQDLVDDLNKLYDSLSAQPPKSLLEDYYGGKEAVADPMAIDIPNSKPKSPKKYLLAAALLLVVILLSIGITRPRSTVPKTEAAPKSTTADTATPRPAPPPPAVAVSNTVPVPENKPVKNNAPAAQTNTRTAPPPPQTPAPATIKQAAKPQPAQAAAAPPPKTETPPIDARLLIDEGKSLLTQNRPQEALTRFQQALRTPSASMPRQEIIKQSLHGSARATTVLYRQGNVPGSKYEAAWQAVQNAFPAGTPEHNEASNHLKNSGQ